MPQVRAAPLVRIPNPESRIPNPRFIPINPQHIHRVVVSTVETPPRIMVSVWLPATRRRMTCRSRGNSPRQVDVLRTRTQVLFAGDRSAAGAAAFHRRGAGGAGRLDAGPGRTGQRGRPAGRGRLLPQGPPPDLARDQ